MRLCIYLLFFVTLASCSGVERANKKPRPVRSKISFSGEVPNMLRGTIKQHVALMGYADTYSEQYTPIVAAGYGLVVGLNGTGSSEMPPQVRAHMVADLAKRGLGESTRGWGHVKPDQLLNSNETAVVIVEAAIPQAASGRKRSRANMREDHPSLQGTVFDVHVYAEPSSSTTSLEGGILLSTLLRQGELKTGRSQTREVATASGPIFINPFAKPNAINSDSVHRTSGRILEGGEVLYNMPMRLVLFEPSHSRATLIQTAVNRVFPEEPGQDGPTAHGLSSEMIEIRVPPSWKDDVPTFMELLTHITMRSQNPEGVAMSVKRLLIADPSPRNADAAMWRWRAIGSRSLSVIRPLYEHPDSLPRIAALRAGGGLDDPIAVPYLLEEATSRGALGSRLDAIELLETMPRDYRIEKGLRPLLNDKDVEIRLRTAEALVKRDDTSIKRYSIPDKFDLIHVPSEYKMIYVTQTGYPQIILAGDIEVSSPLTLQAWDNNLIIKNTEDETNDLLVRYQDIEKNTTTIEHIAPELPIFTMFLAHESTPEAPAPGLDLSYSKTIGALHALWRQEYIKADFKVEQDRLLAAIQRLTSETSFVRRPDFEPETEGEEPPRFIDQPKNPENQEIPVS